MRQRRDRARLALEARQGVGVGGHRRRDDLDRDVAPQPRVAGAIDLPHPPAPMGARISYGPSRVPGVERGQGCGDHTRLALAQPDPTWPTLPLRAFVLSHFPSTPFATPIHWRRTTSEEPPEMRVVATLIALLALLAPAGPSPRYAHQMMTFDGQRVLMFGGAGTDGSYGDLWAFDARGWSQLPQSGPGERNSGVFAYDSIRKRAVLYGGRVHDTLVTATWEWDGAAWHRIGHGRPDPKRPWRCRVRPRARRGRAVPAGPRPRSAPSSDAVADLDVGWPTLDQSQRASARRCHADGHGRRARNRNRLSARRATGRERQRPDDDRAVGVDRQRLAQGPIHTAQRRSGAPGQHRAGGPARPAALSRGRPRRKSRHLAVGSRRPGRTSARPVRHRAPCT